MDRRKALAGMAAGVGIFVGGRRTTVGAVAAGPGVAALDGPGVARRCEIAGHRQRVQSVASAPGVRLLATGSWDKSVGVWDAETGHERETHFGHVFHVVDVAFSHDGRRWASSSAASPRFEEGGARILIQDGGVIKLWDVSTKREPITNVARLGLRDAGGTGLGSAAGERLVPVRFAGLPWRRPPADLRGA
jgi:hypothetical protein